MRLSEYCTSQDVDRAIAVTVDSFVSAQKVSCRKALGRAFAKYVFLPPFFRFFLGGSELISEFVGTHSRAQTRRIHSLSGGMGRGLEG